MKSLATFNIMFDNSHGTYYSGQHVTGRVYIRLLRQKQLRGIELRFSGLAQVHWSDDRNEKDEEGNTHKVTDHYWAREHYFENNFFVFGGPYADTTLPPGEYYYQFRLILPQMIPSSYESEFGHVRYTCRGVILRPWKSHHECKVAFTVLNPVDLNLEPNILNPPLYTKEKHLLCCCCRSGPITLVVSLPSRGFVPGQSVNGVVEVDNTTDSTVHVKSALIQQVTFTASCHACTQTKRINNIVAHRRIGFVDKRGSITSQLDLPIPALPASYLQNCSCIDISYVLEITGAISGAHSNLKTEVPLVIGTIPLRSQRPSSDPHLGQSSVHTNAQPAMLISAEAQEPSAPADPLSRYPEIPPPSYEECTSGKVNIRSEEDSQYVEGSMEFAPRYPIYKF